MIFLQFSALLVINAGYLIMIFLLPAIMAVVLAAVCARAIMIRLRGRRS